MQKIETTRKFEGKVVLITGASKGIGAATALAFAKEAARLAILARNTERLKATATKCKDAGAEVLEIPCDLAEFEHLETVVEKTVERFDGIDILINNAAILTVAPAEAIEVEWYRRVFQVNVDAPVFLCQYALPHIKKSKGCIVNVSSLLGFKPLPGTSSYGMSKAALDYFTKVLSSGLVDTDITHNTNLPVDVGEQLKLAVLKDQPLGYTTTEETAEGILFLCSSRKVTGARGFHSRANN